MWWNIWWKIIVALFIETVFAKKKKSALLLSSSTWFQRSSTWLKIVLQGISFLWQDKKKKKKTFSAPGPEKLETWCSAYQKSREGKAATNYIFPLWHVAHKAIKLQLWCTVNGWKIVSECPNHLYTAEHYSLGCLKQCNHIWIQGSLDNTSGL